MSQNETTTAEEIRPAADLEFEALIEREIKPHVPMGVYTRLIESVNGVAKAHYGRGFLEGGRASWGAY